MAEIIKPFEFRQCITILKATGKKAKNIRELRELISTVSDDCIFHHTYQYPKERDIAMVFQIYALYPHMTVYDNISFPLKMKKTDDRTIHNEVDRVAGILGIKELLHRKPKELSGGQRQRVALGRAIIRKPKVFLMDEPLSNLDARPLRINLNRTTTTPSIEALIDKKSVIAGIRPEDISITDVQSEDCIEITVTLIEPAGSFNWVDIMWNDISIKGYAQVDANLKAGERAFMKFPIKKILLFDADSGKRI